MLSEKLCDLCKEAVGDEYFIASNDWMNDELEIVAKETVVWYSS
jgi:hypothetical protein